MLGLPVLCCSLLGAALHPASAQTSPPYGGVQFQINQSYGPQSGAKVARNARGDFVVVWSFDPFPESTATRYRQIYARAYTADGRPRGGEILVNTHDDDEVDPAVAIDADGNFVVAWTHMREYEDTGIADAGSGILARRFAADGTPRDAQDRAVNVTVSADQYQPVVAMNARGDYLLVWHSAQAGASYDDDALYARAFNADGSARGDEFPLTLEATPGIPVALRWTPAGTALVAWERGLLGDEYGEIVVTRLRANGRAVGADIPVHFGFNPALATDPLGNFVVAFDDAGDDLPANHIYAVRYTADGQAAAPVFQVSPGDSESGSSYLATVSAGAAGGFVMAWNSGDLLAGAQVIAGRRYTADGTAIDVPYVVNDALPPGLTVGQAAVAAGGDGYVVVWTTRAVQAGATPGVYARVYRSALPRHARPAGP